MEIPESHLSPKVKGAILPDDLLNPTATATTANQDVDESDETNVAQPLEMGPLVLQLSYSLSGGPPWRILNDGRWRVFQHHELPETGPLGVEVERIQGLPGKAETISNTIINELDNSVKQTQAIILSSSREAAQKIHTLVSASATSAFVTTHLSIGGSNIHEDRQQLMERPHIVIGTIGRIFSMLERKTINSPDIKILCVDNIQHLPGPSYVHEFAEFCEHLSKDTDIIFLSTKIRYRTFHDLSKLFTREPLHFLVKEDPAPEPSAIPHDSEPAGVDPNQNEDTTRSAIIPHTDGTPLDFTQFRCQVGECRSKFRTKDDLRSHVRFFHWQTTSKPGEGAAVAGDDVPYDDKVPGRTEGVMYLCGLCERYAPFKSSWAFGRHLKRMHLEWNNVTVSKVGLATHSASDGPYMDTYLVHQTEGTAGSSESESVQDCNCKNSGSLDDCPF